MKRKLFSAAAFILVLGIILISLNSAFSFKYLDGNMIMQNLYAQPKDTVDVLCLGTSHIYMSLDPSVLWSEKGITALDLGGSAQPMWNTYYYLLEALKTQSPKVVLIDTYFMYFQDDYGSPADVIKNTYGFKLSTTKLDNIRVSVSPDELWDYALPFLQYHGRYNDLTKNDWFRLADTPQWYWSKGYLMRGEIAPQGQPEDMTEVLQSAKLSEKTAYYFRNTIDLALESGAKVLVCSVPFFEVPSLRTVSNAARDIVESYDSEDVSFVNFNDFDEEMGLDYGADLADKQHLNWRGGQKFSKYLADYLDKNYELDDHREEEGYDSWVNNTRVRNRLYLDYDIPTMTDPVTYLSALRDVAGDENSQYALYVALNGIKVSDLDAYYNEKVLDRINSFQPAGDDEIATLTREEAELNATYLKLMFGSFMETAREWLPKLGIADDMSKEMKNGFWSIKNGALDRRATAADEDCFWPEELSRFDDIALKYSAESGVYSVLFNGEDLTQTDEGLTFVLYDRYLGQIVDAAGWQVSSPRIVHADLKISWTDN
ncbi:MAG: hypothetical protein IIZ66_05955 [Clostridia bacterium]|nr:hypothetical protein [Clostridia bacterium]